MSDERIQCPSCGAEIPLSEAIRGNIEGQLRQELEASQKRREDVLRAGFEKRLAEEETRASERAREQVGVQLTSLQQELAERRSALEESRKREVELMRTTRELEEAKEKLDLELERRLAAEKGKIEQVVAERMADEHRLKDREKDERIHGMLRQIEELKRRAEQGSQQTQGEVAELDLEELLRGAFPSDELEPVPKGRRGADLVQRVRSPSGKPCGAIVWECKRTKAWSDDWLVKLRDDQRELRAELAVIVSSVLPRDVRGFAQIDGVWVAELACTLGVAAALRAQLVQVAVARAAAEARGTTQELVYDYLTGTEFRHRVESVVEAFRAMKDDLERERRALESIWAKRDKQIVRALSGMAGMVGDMQGLVGPSFPTIAALQLSSGPDDEQD